MDKTFTSYQIEERSYVSYIKRAIHNEVAAFTFSENQIGKIDIVVSELASNLVKHAGSGEFLYRVYLLPDNESVFEIISIDSGPGIDEPVRMLRDGASTTNTLGQGLGAITRLSTFSQLYSLPGWGTVVYSRISSSNASLVQPTPYEVDIEGLCVSKPREILCGDGFRIKRKKSSVLFFLGDGLGHGEHAHHAVKAAGDVFESCYGDEPVEILRAMHESVRKTRGLVATVAVLDKARKEWRVCGVGNISARLYSGIAYKSYIAYNGVIGLNIPGSMKVSVFPFERNQNLLLASDGIRSRWEISRYPGILKYDGLVMAAAVYKDFTRRNDDASVLVAKVT
jgi:anti-sigma regulatory factor (Ser/Thr protein kinase)